MGSANGEVMIEGRPLVLATRAQMRIEQEFSGRSLTSILSDVGVTVIVACLKHGMDISEGEAIDIVDRLGLETVGAKIGEAVEAAFPKSKAGAANPQKAASTG